MRESMAHGQDGPASPIGGRSGLRESMAYGPPTPTRGFGGAGGGMRESLNFGPRESRAFGGGGGFGALGGRMSVARLSMAGGGEGGGRMWMAGGGRMSMAGGGRMSMAGGVRGLGRQSAVRGGGGGGGRMSMAGGGARMSMVRMSFVQDRTSFDNLFGLDSDSASSDAEEDFDHRGRDEYEELHGGAPEASVPRTWRRRTLSGPWSRRGRARRCCTRRARWRRCAAASASSTLGREFDEELCHGADDLLDALPLLMQVMQSVGDVFSGEEIAMNAQEDIAKSSHAHDVVDDEVETYGKLRRCVRLDRFSEPPLVHVPSRLAERRSRSCTRSSAAGDAQPGRPAAERRGAAPAHLLLQLAAQPAARAAAAARAHEVADVVHAVLQRGRDLLRRRPQQPVPVGRRRRHARGRGRGRRRRRGQPAHAAQGALP